LDDTVWTVPNQYESGVYKWTITIKIFPIPFVSGVVASLLAQKPMDEEKLNQSLRDQGVSGTATIIDKKVTLTKEFWGTAVSKVTIEYTVAFTPTHLGAPLALNHAMLFAWTALIPFIPLIKATLIALVAIILILKVESVISRIFGPKEYTPYQAGDCAVGWVYDSRRGICVKTTGEIPNIMLLGGLAVAALLITRRGKGD